MQKVLTILFLFFYGFSQGQNAKIQGIVFSDDSLQKLQNVSIFLKNSSFGTISDKNGKFLINEIPAGIYEFSVSSIGFQSQTKSIELKENQTININFYLIEALNDLPTIEIQGNSLTGGKEGIRQMMGSVNYISPKEIQKFNYSDINRTLRSIPGVNLQEEDGFGLRPNIGLRGTGSERSSKITLMEDGILMAPAPYAAPAAYYFPTIGRMQAIEILKGSSQIKYGPYTTGGAINLISTPIPDDFSVRLHLLGGSFGGRNLHAFAGDAFEQVAFLVETFQYQADGFKQLDGGGDTGFDKKDYLAKMRINTKKDAKIYQALTFKMAQAEEKSNETYLGLTENDFEKTPFRRYSASQKDFMQTNQKQFVIKHLAQFKNLTFNTNIYRTDFHRNWYKLDKVVDSLGNKISINKILNDENNYVNGFNYLTNRENAPENSLLVKANNRTYYAQGIQSNLNWKFNINGLNNTLEASIRIHEDQIDRFQWIDSYALEDGKMKLSTAGIPGTESNRIETANALAAFVQHKINWKKWTIKSGIRYENITIKRKDFGKNDLERKGINLSNRENKVSVWIPGFGINYEIEKTINAFLGIHKGFAPPGSKEGTLPEESWNYEAGIRWDKNAFSGEMILFLNDYENLLGSDLAASGGLGTNDLLNGGTALSKGLEMQLTYDLLKTNSKFNLPIALAYTYINAKFENDFESDFDAWQNVNSGDELPYLSNHQLAISASLEHQKFSLNFNSKYQSEMRTQAGQNDISSNELIPSYILTDVSFSYLLNTKILLFGAVNNVFNEIYLVSRRPAGLRPGLPRSFNFGLKFDI